MEEGGGEGRVGEGERVGRGRGMRGRKRGRKGGEREEGSRCRMRGEGWMGSGKEGEKEEREKRRVGKEGGREVRGNE